MSGKLIDFDTAKAPHVFKRQNEKMADIKQAFQASRAEAGAVDLKKAKALKKKRNKNKGPKKR